MDNQLKLHELCEIGMKETRPAKTEIFTLKPGQEFCSCVLGSILWGGFSPFLKEKTENILLSPSELQECLQKDVWWNMLREKHPILFSRNITKDEIDNFAESRTDADRFANLAGRDIYYVLYRINDQIDRITSYDFLKSLDL